MSWNTEETQRKLRDAATAEFATYGLHGTTVDRIAKRAGVNKERLYKYFGNKQQLFTTVLSHELIKISKAVPLTSMNADDLGDFAGRVYDYNVAHPELVRLMHWEGLSLPGRVPDEPERSRYYRKKVDAFAVAQAEGGLPQAPEASHLVMMVLALTAWWFAVPHVTRMVTGTEDTDDEHLRRRAAVVWAARRLAAPDAPGERWT
ncbi:TetR family transcriptional regulator [Streptomyces sp. NPDC096205]|uniref:TetR family transcriptional regulator n=1 Tax=Streptomyces sp. NPDC096205 TaxID=3366081 RepID=UPI0038234D60